MPDQTYSFVVPLTGTARFASAPGSNIVYITNGTSDLLRFDLTTGTFLTSIAFGGPIDSVSASQNGAYVYARVSGSTTSVQRLEVATGAVQTITLTENGASVPVQALAVDAQGNLYIASSAQGGLSTSGLFILRPDQVTVTTAEVTRRPFDRVSLDASPDGHHFVGVIQGISTTFPYIIDTQTGQIRTPTFLSGPNADRHAVSSTGGLVAVSSTREVVVFTVDGTRRAAFDLSDGINNFGQAGAEFTADGHHLMIWDSGTDRVRMYETAAFTEVTSFALELDVPSAQSFPSSGNMYVSQNGQTLFLDGLTGMEVVDLAQVISAFNLTGTAGNDTLLGSIKADTLSGGDGDDTIAGGALGDTLSGGNGIDTVRYSSSDAGVFVNLQTQSATGGHATGDTLSGFESVIGSLYNDVMVGTDGVNTLSGNSGNDTIYGLAGADQMTGGNGIDILIGGLDNDNLAGGFGNDYLYGDDGNDSLIGDDGDDVLVAAAGNDTLIAGAGTGFDYLYAGEGDDTLYAFAPNTIPPADTAITVQLGEGGNDNMTGGQGRDYMYGGTGADQITGLGGIDILIGEGGNDLLSGGSGQDYLYAGDGNDALSGGAGVDFMLGEAGDDQLSGGLDVNYLYGGSGADVFIQSRGNAGVDVISDFAFGLDKIRLFNSTITSFAALQSAITYNASNGFTIIETGVTAGLGNSASIWLAGDVRQILSAADFEFVTAAEDAFGDGAASQEPFDDKEASRVEDFLDLPPSHFDFTDRPILETADWL